LLYKFLVGFSLIGKIMVLLGLISCIMGVISGLTKPIYCGEGLIYITSVVRNFLSSVKGLEKLRADTVDGYRDLAIAFRIRETLSKGFRAGDYVIGEAVEIQYERRTHSSEERRTIEVVEVQKI